MLVGARKVPSTSHIGLCFVQTLSDLVRFNLFYRRDARLVLAVTNGQH